MSTSNSAIHHPLPHTGVPGSDVRRLNISDILSKSKKCLSSKLLGIPEAVHNRLMFAMRSLAGDLKVFSSMSETMAKIISSIGFVFLFDRVRVNGVIMTKIVASDGEFGDYFGYSASMDGDYVIIGAFNDDVGGNTSQGSAYIFMRSSNVWSQQANITASDGAAADNFGWAVSLSGDYALVGAFNDFVGANEDQGSAYVFLRSGTAWNQQAKLTSSNGAAFDYCGWSVSIFGDYALLGCDHEDVSGNINQGAAYIYLRSGSVWNQQAILTASDGADDDHFSRSSALSDDYALIGAYHDDIGSNTDQGSAYIFMRSGVSWNQQAKLIASDGESYDYFGVSAVLEDSYALIGAYNKTEAGNASQGSAYIFMGSGSDWSEQAILTASDGASNDYFGFSVSIDGDYALVGAYEDDVDGAADQGSAYVFMRSGSDWDEQIQLTASDGGSGDYFGGSVTLDGEFAIISSPADGFYRGAAYTYCLDGQTWEDCENVVVVDDDMMDDDTADDNDGSMMIGGASILGLSLISLLIIM